MSIAWIDLETAFMTVRDDPLASGWVNRLTGELRLICDIFDAQAPGLEDGNWVELPPLEELQPRCGLAEDFVRRHCPELSLPTALCFSKSNPWRHFRDLLEQHGYLTQWQHYEAHANREAIHTWAQEQALSLVMS